MAMTRRHLFGLFSTALAACGLGTTVVSVQERHYGPMTVERHRGLCQQGVHLHVLHHGQDITRRCVFADDTGDGMAEVYLLDIYERKYLFDYSKEIVYGVTFVEGAPL